MVELPTGMVTFLFTDIEGSTLRWERAPEQMTEALARHDAILRDTLDRCGGVLCQTAGDSFVVAFASAPAALDMALMAQRTLQAEAWPAEIGALRVRMALHTGMATQRADGYDANHTLTRQARLLATAHAHQILVSGTSRELLADHLPDDVGLRDMGELWLKDLIEPERVFQVVASKPPWSLPEDFPPLRSQRQRPGNLLTPPLPFVGRQLAVEELSAFVTEGQLRLTTLVGPGGIGKTRLALRVAERVQHHFADGVFFVDLAAVTDVDLVMPAIGATLGLSESDDPAASLAEHLSDRNLLLVLDNLEQVIDTALDVAKLLAAAPSLRVLATSRIPLHVLSEHEYAVAPLELPDLEGGGDVVAAFAQSEAMALFVERATAATPGFTLTSANARTVATICHRLDGIPLALLLAAARLKVLTPQAMLDRLEDRLGLLTGGARDLPTRHQTLRDTIEWSYDLLDDEQKAQYARWSVFVGGFGLEAAQTIDLGGGTELATLEGLVSLTDNSLLVAVESPDGEKRYRMLETINEHGREKLDADGLTGETERAHTQFFLGFAEEAAGHLEGEQVVLWSGRLAEDHDNMRAALSRGFERSGAGDIESAQVVVRLATALALFWNDRGHLTEGRRHLEGALELVPLWLNSAADEDERLRAMVASAVISDFLGSISRRSGDLIDARRFLENALDVYRSLDDERGQGRALAAMGTVSLHEGNPDASRSAHTQSLDLSRSAGDQFTVVSGLISLGNVERDHGSTELARSFYEQAFDTAVEIHEFIGQSVALNNLANLAIDAGEVEQAHGLHLRSLDLRHDVGYRIMVAESMVGVAAVELALGRPQRAAQLIGFAEGLADDVGGTFDPAEQRLYERAIATIKDDFGEVWLGEERGVGRNMTLEAAMACARQGDSR